MKNMEIQVKIDNFEGPLDLLIHLIEKKQMNIMKINISQIIDDYLSYINYQKNENLKIKVDFLIMATELLEIKAYSILNKEKKDEKIENLEKRILEYKLFKEISELFSENEHEYNISYEKKGKKNIEQALVEYDISNLTLENLAKSFQNLIKQELKQEKMFLSLDEEYSSEEGFDEIKQALSIKDKIEFSFLLKQKFTKIRIVTLFLCVLEMFKNGSVDLIIDNEKNFYIKKLMFN